MEVFCVSRRSEPGQPLLLVSAPTAADAVHAVEDHEDAGTFADQGYRESEDGYLAAPATPAQRECWHSSPVAARRPQAMARVAGSVLFLLPPDGGAPDRGRDTHRSSAR
jgi:hypothetical protein